MESLLRVEHTQDSTNMPLVWMGLLATSTTFIAYRMISYANPISQLLQVAAYFAMYILVRAIQYVTWSWAGVKSHRTETEHGRLYEESVQVRRIIHKGRLSTMNHPRPWDFLGLHERFAHPRTLLRPDVSLYCVTKSHAYFVECPKDIDVHSSKTSPFMYMAQFEHAIKIYSLPLVHFHSLADEVGDPNASVLWISSTGRCGSTLLIQMLENLPGTVCMSEPDVTTNICLMSRAQQLEEAEISRLVQSSIRLLCKESHSVERFVIKTRFNCSTELTIVQEHFPDFKHLYLYRNLGHVLKSYYKFLHRDLAICILEYIANNKIVKLTLTGLRRYQVHFVAGDVSKKKLKPVFNNYTFMGFVTALIGSCVVEFQSLLKERDLEIPTLHYDDLMRSPLKVTRKLFEMMDFPQEYVKLSLSAMEHDTQKGTILSNISNGYNKKMTARDVKDCNLVCRLLGLPDMNQSFSLPHPIQA